MSIRKLRAYLQAVDESGWVDPSQHASDTRVQQAWSTLALVNGWVVHAEAKLGVTLAFLGAIFAALIALVSSSRCPSVLVLVLAGIATVLTLAAALCAARGLLPRSRSSHKANLLYYADISRHFGKSPEAYARRLSSALSDTDELLQQIVQQIHANALVATQKYQWTHLAITLGAGALVATGAVAVASVVGW